MARIRKHTSRELADHIVDKTQFVELGATDAPIDNVMYDVQKGEVHADPLIDSGSGRRLIVRRFQFKLPPGLAMTPSSDELLDWHKKHTVIPTLWKDELELIDEPRIISGKKGVFTIVAICAPRTVLGVKSAIYERPELIQDIIQNNGKSRPNSK